MLIIFGRKQMASLLFTLLSSLLGAGINATAFAGASLGFSMLRDDGGKERKRHDLAEEKLQRTRGKWNEDRMKRLDFINKRQVKKMRQGHISTMLMKQCLSTIEYLQNK